MSFVLKRQHWVGSWMGAGHRKSKPWLEVWNFQPSPLTPFSREGRKAGSGVNIWSHPCEEAAIKMPIVWGLENFQVLRSGVPREGMEALHSFPHPLSYTFLPFGCSPASFYNKLVNCFPEFCEFLSQINQTLGGGHCQFIANQSKAWVTTWTRGGRNNLVGLSP